MHVSTVHKGLSEKNSSARSSRASSEICCRRLCREPKVQYWMSAAVANLARNPMNVKVLMELALDIIHLMSALLSL